MDMHSTGKKKRKDDARAGPIWWCETDHELIARVVDMYEANDSEDFERDSNWIEWDLVAPDGMSAAEARERWDALSRDVPRRRTNLEIARIVQKNFNGARLTGNVLNTDQYQKVANMRRHPMKLKAQDLYPDIPKRPMSAFFLWAEQHRDEVRAQLPTAQAKDIQRILGERWRETPEEVKDEFKRKAQEAMEKYYAEMEEFYEMHPEAKSDKKLSRVPLKKPKIGDEAPKPPPRSGYLLFLQEVRPSMPHDMPFTEAVKLIATQWHELSEEVRKSYSTRLEELWQKYEEDWRAFMQTIPSHQQPELEKMRKHHLNKSRAGMRESKMMQQQQLFARPKLREPVKPTAYKMFVAANKDQLETQLPEEEKARINSKLREMWKILDPKAKEPFEIEAKKAEHKYHQDWLEYERVLKEQDTYKHLEPTPAPPPAYHAPAAPPAAAAASVEPAMPEPFVNKQWMYKEGNKYVPFPEKDTSVLDRAYRQWKKSGSLDEVMELNLMSDECVVDFKNMWFTTPGGDPIRLKQKIIK